MTSLFDPITLRGVTARNRIWLAPMCQYSCFEQDGMPDDWHLVHLGSHATGGFGLVMTEAAAVAPEGRISPEDAGIWSDDHIAPWRRITDFVRSHGAVPAIQLAHAGRKASVYSPFGGGLGTVPAAGGGWPTSGPTSNAFDNFAPPAQMTIDDIAGVIAAFAAAAVRSESAGFDVIEVHAAHGYLLHQFLSPLVNDRTDKYGGSFENRIRIVVEVVDAIREVWPDHKPLIVRPSATDWADGGWDVDQTVQLSEELKKHGVDLVDVSSGGAVPHQEIVLGPGYQVPFAEQVRKKADIPVGAVGLITTATQAQQILDDGQADVVLLARAALGEPRWPLRAAHELGLDRHTSPIPPQFSRATWS